MKHFGNIAVPFATAWAAEQKFWIAPCLYACGALALHQEDARGQGKPTFAKPHMNRQREAVYKGLCDICGLSLKNATKVSMSEERRVIVDGIFLPLVVEPLCHKHCAKIAAQACPHLKRRLREGLIVVRQVFKYAIAAQQLTREATMEACGEYRPYTVGHLKMQLLNIKERDMEWLL